jgi:hypothetical protein
MYAPPGQPHNPLIHEVTPFARTTFRAPSFAASPNVSLRLHFVVHREAVSHELVRLQPAWVLALKAPSAWLPRPVVW